MKTTIQLTRQGQQLTLTHETDDGYRGIVVVPTDPFSTYALEVVTAPSGVEIHRESFEASNLGENSDLEPYLVGMTRSARNNFRRVS